jgi:hypothetical protein
VPTRWCCIIWKDEQLREVLAAHYRRSTLVANTTDDVVHFDAAEALSKSRHGFTQQIIGSSHVLVTQSVNEHTEAANVCKILNLFRDWNLVLEKDKYWAGKGNTESKLAWLFITSRSPWNELIIVVAIRKCYGRTNTNIPWA